MHIKRPAYFVLMAPDGVDPNTATDDELDELHVVIHNVDQLKGELETGKLGLREGGRQTPLHVTTLWAWQALVRTERFAGTFQEFKARCVAVEPDRERDQPHTVEGAALDEHDAHPTEASTG